MQISFVSQKKFYMQPGPIPVQVGDILVFNGQPKNNLTIFRNKTIVKTTTNTLLGLQGMVTAGILALPEDEKAKAAQAVGASVPLMRVTTGVSAHNHVPSTMYVPRPGAAAAHSAPVHVSVAPVARTTPEKPAGLTEGVQTKKIADAVVIAPVKATPAPVEVKTETPAPKVEPAKETVEAELATAPDQETAATEPSEPKAEVETTKEAESADDATEAPASETPTETAATEPSEPKAEEPAAATEAPTETAATSGKAPSKKTAAKK